MKECYLTRDFRKTAAQRFPAQAAQLNAAFDTCLRSLWAENAGASKEKKQHLAHQILPGIAAYEVLQTVMPKDEALQTIHGYVEQLARTTHKYLAAMLRLPGLYRVVPGLFVKSTRTNFGPAADGPQNVVRRHDKMPVSRHLRAVRLSGAVPLLL